MLKPWRKATGGEKIIIALTALLVFFAAQAAVRSCGSSSPDVGPSGDKPSAHTASAPGEEPPGEPHPPVFLERLHPSEGDEPQGGHAVLRGRSFPHSIFYEEIGDPSSAELCPEPSNCRATFYELGGDYETFTASFGLLAHGSSAAGLLPTAEWRVKADGGKVLDQDDDVVANAPPESVRVPVRGVQVLELWVEVLEPGIGESNTAVWGNARVS